MALSVGYGPGGGYVVAPVYAKARKGRIKSRVVKSKAARK
jgi:hypothetical protein